ncbi:hypothetical protein EGT74_06630 [Chitinophaga lutea]|uniref:Uncharacterized protein n=2 Tax=Chitinophaga lutea TaxID=2488634 RepID=A0A3N4Q6N8_9BACT|nr:hypothetical protein EGT74_06630 [Chitinophaga lutea]
MYPTAEWVAVTDHTTGKITLLFKYPFAGPVPPGEDKKMWERARGQAQLVYDFVFADSSNVAENVLFCFLIDGKRENSYCDKAIPANLLDQPPTFCNNTQQRLNRIAAALPRSSTISLDSIAGVIAVRLNGKIYNLPTIQDYNNTADYYAVLIYSYIFLRDQHINDLRISFVDAPMDYAGQSGSYYYNRKDSLFQGLQRRLLPDLEQIQLR